MIITFSLLAANMEFLSRFGLAVESDAAGCLSLDGGEEVRLIHLWHFPHVGGDIDALIGMFPGVKTGQVFGVFE